MNWQQGLERISAVWWGMWALVCIVFAVAFLFKEPMTSAGAIAALLVIYLMHKLTCWVISGFFAPKH